MSTKKIPHFVRNDFRFEGSWRKCYAFSPILLDPRVIPTKRRNALRVGIPTIRNGGLTSSNDFGMIFFDLDFNQASKTKNQKSFPLLRNSPLPKRFLTSFGRTFGLEGVGENAKHFRITPLGKSHSD